MCRSFPALPGRRTTFVIVLGLCFRTPAIRLAIQGAGLSTGAGQKLAFTAMLTMFRVGFP